MQFALFLLFTLAQSSGGGWDLHLTLNGSAAGEVLGIDVSACGDLDGDEVPEIIIGAPLADVGGMALGKVFVRSGTDGGLIYEFVGPIPAGGFNTFFGEHVSAADVDGDGCDDILVGAAFATPFGQRVGSAYVYSGKDGSEIYRLDGVEFSECFGANVIGLDDVDQDGGEDFVIYSDDRDTFGSGFGAALVYSGKTGSLLFEIGGPWAGTGAQGASLGDINDDSWSDFVLSDTRDDGSVAAYSGFDGSEIYKVSGPLFRDNFGFSVGATGDVNLDGITDFIVGAPESITNLEGHAYVYSGVDGALLFSFIGENNNDTFGEKVDGAGDVDGDGFPDFIISAPFYNFTIGAVYVYSGFDGRLLAKFLGDGLFVKNLGSSSVVGLGDVNTNGLSDIAMSTSRGAFNGDSSGTVLVYTLDSYLQAGALEISAAIGGTIQFSLNFPDTEGGRTYQLLASKPNPGRIGPNFNIPLVDSPTLRQMYLNPPSIFSAPIGTLDANGDALLTMTLIPGQASAYVGNICRFSAITHENASTLGLASATVDIEVMP